MNIKDMFINAVGGNPANVEELDVVFVHGDSAKFTTDIFSLLVTDPAVSMVMSAETGELYFDREDGYIQTPENYR